MNALEQKLLAALRPWRDAPAWRVALSGGLDSSVLLHLLARLRVREELPPLSAVHVHHGLQEAADAWPAHCRVFCERLDVPLQVEFVRVASGASLERAARDARYAAFERCLERGELLLTGQHRDDQVETLLFRLLRGAGVRGLAGMPQSRSLGRGLLVRPLLDVPRSELEGYARDEGLSWVEDPSNADTALSRNFLRHAVLPPLAQRWPQLGAALARTAGHMAEAQQLLGELAEQDLASTRGEHSFAWLGVPSLELAPLLCLSEMRQRNALRHWLAPLTQLPDHGHWAGWNDLRDAAGDAVPIWRLAGGELRRSDGRLWWLADEWLSAPGAPALWSNLQEPLPLPGNGRLQLFGEPPCGALEVRYRLGGETMLVPGRGQRDLKRLLNERGVPTFARARLPLLFRGTQLLAVANLAGLDRPDSGEWHLRWCPPTCAQGLSC